MVLSLAVVVPIVIPYTIYGTERQYLEQFKEILGHLEYLLWVVAVGLGFAMISSIFP